jgi:hypothetical protein
VERDDFDHRIDRYCHCRDAGDVNGMRIRRLPCVGHCIRNIVRPDVDADRWVPPQECQELVVLLCGGPGKCCAGI